MNEEYQEHLFNKFNKEHDKFKDQMRKIDDAYITYALRRLEHEIAIFVDDLLKNTGITLSGQREDEYGNTGS